MHTNTPTYRSHLYQTVSQTCRLTHQKHRNPIRVQIYSYVVHIGTVFTAQDPPPPPHRPHLASLLPMLAARVEGIDASRLLVLSLCLIASPSSALATTLPPLVSLGDGAPAVKEAVLFREHFANWLVPQHVMLGRYPGSDPRRPISDDAQHERLHDLLAAGVTTFVSLQAVSRQCVVARPPARCPSSRPLQLAS